MNWLDLVITVVIVIGLIRGLFDGVVKQVISLLALAIAIFGAGALAVPARDWLLSFSLVSQNIHSYLVTGICYLLAFCLIIYFLVWLGKLLDNAINVTPVAIFNRLFGGLFGMFLVVLAMSVLLLMLTFFDPNSILITQQTKEQSVLYEGVRSVVPSLYPVIRELLK